MMGEFYSRDSTTILELTGRDIIGSQSVPMVILIGPDTSGAPEIFASAMQSAGRATIIGQASAGEVLGFQQIRLADGSEVSFAVSSFRTPAGRDLALGGIIPDIIVVNDWDTITAGFDPVVQAGEDFLRASAPQ